jgi:hypothetical protein
MKTRIEEQVRQHFADLEKLFPEISGNDPLSFCRKLRRLEMEAHKLAEDNCNGLISDDDYDTSTSKITNEIRGLFGSPAFDSAFYLNGDPRGYSLKLRYEFMKDTSGIHKDWGGFGILAPEFK